MKSLTKAICVVLINILLVSTFAFAGDKEKKDGIGEVIYSTISDKGVEAGIKTYKKMKKKKADKYYFGEGELNNLGYKLLGEGKAEEARRIFELNIEEFPKSPNTYDSLAETYFNEGDEKSATKYYKKALAMIEDSELTDQQKSFQRKNAKMKLVAMNEGKQFDFFLGEWQTESSFNQGEGKWFTWTDTCKTAKFADGNGIVDYWESKSAPSRGLYMRTFNINTNEWEITGQGSLGMTGFTVWNGKWEEDGVGTFFTTNEKMKTTSRITFSNISENSFDWKMDKKKDGEKEWVTTMKMKFNRLKKSNEVDLNLTALKN